MRTQNLKFICAALFAVIFLVGGFFINITKVSAEASNQAFPYSLSSVYSYPNSVGGVTTIVHIGCVPGSGDIYDINTGRLCPYSAPGAMLGCALNSGDKYDVNTGKACINLTSNVMIGCASNSTDLYDINTGKACINNTIQKNTGISVQDDVGGPGKVSINTVTTTDNPILTEGELTEDSITNNEDIGNNLTASGGKIKTMFSWPMSARAISLIVILILGIGYGVYSFIKKDSSNNMLAFTESKNKHKEEVKPIVTAPQAKMPNKPNTQTEPVKNTPAQQPKIQEQPVNNTPQSKIPDTAPLTHTSVNTTPNPQMPLNIPNNPSPQGPVVQK